MKGISLSSVIQVISLEKQSCDIEARADGQRGQLHFRDGALVDAMADGLEGEDAAYEILGWEDPEFDVNNEASPRDRMIEADLTQMLLEVARRHDEELEESTRSAAAQASVPPRLEPSSASETPAVSRADPARATADTIAQMEAAFREPRTEAAMGTGLEPASAEEPAVSPGPAPGAASGPASGAPAPVVPNAAGLKRVVQIAQDGLDEALISADLFSSVDGTSYVGINSQPAVCALVNQVTERMRWAFDKSGLPPLGRYYTVELADSRMLLVALCGALQLSLVVDTGRVQLGLLLNVILPEVLAALEEVSPG